MAFSVRSRDVHSNTCRKNTWKTTGECNKGNAVNAQNNTVVTTQWHLPALGMDPDGPAELLGRVRITSHDGVDRA